MRTLKLVPALLVLTSAVAFAADENMDYFSSAPSRDLTRLSYYAHSGKLYVVPDFVYQPTDYTTTTPGLPANAHELVFDLNLSYGLPIEGLRIGAAETWQIHRWTDTTHANGYVSTTESAGLSDPTFSLAYRLIDSAPTGLAADLTLSGSPSFVDYNEPATTISGNDGRGYGEMSLAATVYWIMDMNDIGATGTATREFSGSATNQTDAANSYSRDSAWTGTASLTDRFHLGEDLYVQGEAIFDFGNSYTRVSDAAPPVTTVAGTSFHVEPALSVGYRIQRCFVLDAIYTYQNYFTQATPDTGAATQTKLVINTVTLQARMEF
jgi:hypothetical protein